MKTCCKIAVLSHWTLLHNRISMILNPAIHQILIPSQTHLRSSHHIAEIAWNIKNGSLHTKMKRTVVVTGGRTLHTFLRWDVEVGKGLQTRNASYPIEKRSSCVAVVESYRQRSCWNVVCCVWVCRYVVLVLQVCVKVGVKCKIGSCRYACFCF